MKTANFTEFRKRAAEFLDEVEKGGVIRILRHGKAVADISPVLAENKPSWKKGAAAASAERRLPVQGHPAKP